MTLRELMERTEKTPKSARTPSASAVLRSGSPVVAFKKIDAEIEIKAFANGYAVYQNGRYVAVIPIHSCGDYRYRCVSGDDRIVPFRDFADQPWYMRIYMEGENRIFHAANNRRDNHGVFSYDVFAEGWYFLTDEGEGDPLRILVEAEASQEKLEKLAKSLGEITERQRFILFECVVKGRSHADVAKEIGTSRVNVTCILQRIMIKIRSSYGIQDRSFGPNRFSRRQEQQ